MTRRIQLQQLPADRPGSGHHQWLVIVTGGLAADLHDHPRTRERRVTGNIAGRCATELGMGLTNPGPLATGFQRCLGQTLLTSPPRPSRRCICPSPCTNSAWSLAWSFLKQVWPHKGCSYSGFPRAKDPKQLFNGPDKLLELLLKQSHHFLYLILKPQHLVSCT